MTCDHCGSDNIEASVQPVRPHGDRLVVTCRNCGTSWINTQPSPVERIVTEVLSARRKEA